MRAFYGNALQNHEKLFSKSDAVDDFRLANAIKTKYHWQSCCYCFTRSSYNWSLCFGFAKFADIKDLLSFLLVTIRRRIWTSRKLLYYIKVISTAYTIIWPDTNWNVHSKGELILLPLIWTWPETFMNTWYIFMHKYILRYVILHLDIHKSSILVMLAIEIWKAIFNDLKSTEHVEKNGVRR